MSTNSQIGNALPISTLVAEHMANANSHHADVVKSGRSMLESARKAGWELRQVKGLLGHGKFMDYVKKHFANRCHRTATNYMRISENWSKLNKRLGELDSINKALAHLRGKPKEESPRDKVGRTVKNLVDDWTEYEIEFVFNTKNQDLLQAVLNEFKKQLVQTCSSHTSSQLVEWNAKFGDEYKEAEWEHDPEDEFRSEVLFPFNLARRRELVKEYGSVDAYVELRRQEITDEFGSIENYIAESRPPVPTPMVVVEIPQHKQ